MVSSTVGSLDHDRLEPPLERRILLDVLAVFVERRRANRVQLAAREHRLEHVRRVHRSFRRAGAHDGVQLVDEEDDLAFGLHDLVEHGLEAIFELAAVFGAGDERAHVERDDLLVLQSLRHILIDDAAGEALDDGGLADAGLADEHGIVLRAPRQHLDDAANLLVAADDRIELAAARELREVAAVLLERLVFGFGILIGHALRASHLREHFEDAILRDVELLQDAATRCCVPPSLTMPSSRCSVLTNSSFSRSASALGGVGHLSQARRQRRLRSAVGGGLPGELGPQLFGERLRLDAHLAQQRRDDAVRLLDEREQQVLGLDLGVIALLGEPLRRQNRFLRFFGVLVQVHIASLTPPSSCRPPASPAPRSARALRASAGAAAPLRPLHRGRQTRSGLPTSGIPLPFRRNTCPFWVPGGILQTDRLSRRGSATSASPPSTAVVTGTRTFACRSCPLRSKRESGVRWMRR